MPRLFLVFAALCGLVYGIADAATVGSRRALPTAPSWVLRGSINNGGGAAASVDCWFATSLYWNCSPTASFTTTRASTKTCSYAGGLIVTAVSGQPCITDQGWLIEEGRTNSALQSRDMTNVAWTASNVTTAETATGADGVVNAATNLTASAANGTVLQSITLVSAAYTYSVFLKRVTGTGEVDITVDNGTTWTAATSSICKDTTGTTSGLVTTGYVICQVTKTAANPVVGVRIVVNGDAVAADFNQLENGAFATSAIPTTTVAVTRAADNVTTLGSVLSILTGNQGTIFSQASNLSNPGAGTAAFIASRNGATDGFMRVASGTSVTARAGGAGVATTSAGSGNIATGQGKIASAFDVNGISLAFNAGTVGTSASTYGAATTPQIGTSGGTTNAIDGFLKRIVFWPSRLPDPVLQRLTCVSGC